MSRKHLLCHQNNIPMRKYSEIAKYDAGARQYEREKYNDDALDKSLELMENLKSTQNDVMLASSKTLKELQDLHMLSKELHENSSKLAQKSYNMNVYILLTSIIALLISLTTLIISLC
jgi:hypothetical protein